MSGEMQRQYKESPSMAVASGLGMGLGALAGGKLFSERAPIMEGVSDLNQKFNPLPLKSRASATLESVAKDAANVPVNMAETIPAIADFRQSVATGGKNAPVMTKLGRRVDSSSAPNGLPVNFPEARDFYKNVSRASAKPGFLRRQLESPAMPDLRRNVGNVREAMNTDLGNAADTVGRGEDYRGGIKEYAQNAKMRAAGRNLGKVGIGLAGAEAAKRLGLLGRIGNKLIGQ